MDELTLEHIAPYLPFDLKVNFYCKLGNCISTGTVSPTYAVQHTNQIKPILRPLSDLTKEVEHNGERFMPIEWFEIGDDFNETVDYGRGNVKLIGLLEDMAKHNFIDLPHIQFGVVSKLIEWHFDVFGLREKNLCVYYNEI